MNSEVETAIEPSQSEAASNSLVCCFYLFSLTRCEETSAFKLLHPLSDLLWIISAQTANREYLTPAYICILLEPLRFLSSAAAFSNL